MADQINADSYDLIASFATDTNRYLDGRQNCSGSVEISTDNDVVNVSTALVNYDSQRGKWSAH